MMGWTGKDPLEWARQSIERMTAVNRRSAEMLAEHMNMTESNGGKLPHKTGNLMRSLLGSTTAMPSVVPGKRDFAGFDVHALTAQLELGQTIYLGFQADYARRMNYGFVGEDSLGRNYNQEGRLFVEWAAGQWASIVAQAVKELRKG